MNEIEIVKKMSEMLKTDIDHIIPSLEKIIKDIEIQKNEMKKLKERMD